jgi:DNA replication and repair protein RecF
MRVRDFRSYEEYELELDPFLTILVGANAAGKTNLVEGLQLLTEADSFRKPSWAEVIRLGSQDGARLSLEAKGAGRVLDVDLEISPTGRRAYKVNGKARRAVNQVAGVLPCVIFTPEDLRLVKDAAEKRRTALDSLGSQLSPTYSRLRTDYEKILRQRNTLLREEASDEDLSPWTHRLIEVGSSLVVHRRRLFSRIKEAMIKVYSELAQDGPLEATYLTSWERDAAVSGDVEPGEAMKRHLEIKRPAERARRSTISGPHRDDIEFRIAGREARAYASQGQQRTIALAWKLAEVSVTTDIASQRPLLLLDDVMSELDEERRHALAGFVGSVAQTVMTTTNLGYFERALLDRARVVIL